MSKEITVELRVVSSRGEAEVPPAEDAPPPLASARKAVPLLWLGLFDFDEAEVRGSEPEVFLAVAEVGAAIARADALARALPLKDPPLAAYARLLAHALRARRPDHLLVLYPTELFASLRREHVRLYLERLFGICEVWERLRTDLTWPEARPLFDKLGPELKSVLENEEKVLCYYLLGNLAERFDPLEEVRVSEGQGQADQEPEALAAGEQGLLIGRFGGKWKLMTSGTDQDLRSIWGEPGNVFIVGRRGTVLRLRKGVCSAMESPTTSHLQAAWGQSPRFVVAAGDDGALVVFQGKKWAPWPLPTKANLVCLGGAGPEVLVGAQDLSVMRYDGRTWTKTLLPDEGAVSRIWSQDGQLFAIGGSRRGGELYTLRRGGWERDDKVPRADWFEAMWHGWGDELGLVSASGPLLVRKQGTWTTEPTPAPRIVEVAAGTQVLAVGQTGRYSVLFSRHASEGWKLEASVPELRLAAIWVVGRPRPPRLEPTKAPPVVPGWS